MYIKVSFEARRLDHLRAETSTTGGTIGTRLVQLCSARKDRKINLGNY